MAITKVAQAATLASSSGKTLTCTIPAGSVLDDLMLIYYTRAGSQNGTSSINEAGWAKAWEINKQGTSSARDVQYALYWKFHDGSENNPVINSGSTSGSTLRRRSFSVSYRNVSLVSPFDVPPTLGVHTNSQLDTDPTAEPITTASNDSLVLISQHIADNNVSAMAYPAGYSRLYDRFSTGHNDCQYGVASKFVASAGLETPGAFINTFSGGGADASITSILALRDAAAVSNLHNIWKGSTNVTKVYLGATTITDVYLASTKIHED